MQITQRPLVDVLVEPGARYVIPVFQRVYSWNARQCQELLGDILRAGRTDEPHFMGLLLFAPDADAHGTLRQVNVIDGQQRMTTMMLLMAAFDEGFTPAPLSLSQSDRATFDAIMAGDELPEEPATRLVDNYLLFARTFEDPGFDMRAFRAGLGCLEVGCVMMTADDSPQLVFESLNSKGMPLSTADRVRNLVVASTADDVQGRLYEDLWLPLEQRADDPTDVLHAWLAERYRSVHIVDASEVYGVFKTCLRDEYDGSLGRLLADVGAYCDRCLADDEFRAEAHENAAAWVAGKPKNSVSELKLFGD